MGGPTVSGHGYEHVAVVPGDGPWWIAHEWPERPVDDWCVWSWSCDPCVLHLVAAARFAGAHRAETFQVHADPEVHTVADVLAAARAWRAERGMPAL